MVESKKEKSEFDESWRVHSSYLDYDVFVKNIKSNHDLIVSQERKREDEEVILSSLVTKKAFSESKNCKKYVRMGVPLRYMKGFLIRLFDLNDTPEQYEMIENTVFSSDFTIDSSPDLLPLFSNSNQLQKVLPFSYLNEEGNKALKEILWIISSIYKNIEYSPLIVKLVMLLLVFLNKHEAYFVIRTVIEMDMKVIDLSAIRWRLRFNLCDYRKLIYAIPQAITEISEKTGKIINSHFKKINFAFHLLIEDMILNFFLEYLDFETVTELVPLFFFEGTKILYRFAFAIVKLTLDKITKITNPDEIIPQVKKFSKEIENKKLLFEKAFQFELTAENNYYSKAIIDEAKLHQNYYRHIPTNKELTILNNSEAIKLFSALPEPLFKKKTTLLYKRHYTESDPNKDLKSLITNLSEVITTSGFLIIIETVDDEIFAALLEGKFQDNSNEQLILYNIRPMFKISLPISGSKKLKITDKVLWFGEGQNGPAIFLENNLDSVFNFKPNSFGFSFVNSTEENRAKIKHIEVFLFDN